MSVMVTFAKMKFSLLPERAEGFGVRTDRSQNLLLLFPSYLTSSKMDDLHRLQSEGYNALPPFDVTKIRQGCEDKELGQGDVSYQVSDHFFLCQGTVRDRCLAAMKCKIATFPYITLW